MNQRKPAITVANSPISILLADDDSDDRQFFESALEIIPIPTMCKSVADGEKLMNFLLDNSDRLPDILFLDLNMPRKNGFECLKEIMLNDKLKLLPVVIFSTSIYQGVEELLYNSGAYYYVRKTNLDDLQMMLHLILTMMIEKKFTRADRDKFLLDLEIR